MSGLIGRVSEMAHERWEIIQSTEGQWVVGMSRMGILDVVEMQRLERLSAARHSSVPQQDNPLRFYSR